MAVTTWVRDGLARRAVRGAAVLLVEVPGGWSVRVAVEREVAARGGRLATSPADADALLVCGAPGDGWDAVLERTWAQLSGPRARGSVRAVGDVGGALDALAADLLDDDAQRADAAARDLAPEDLADGDDMHPGGMELAGGEDDLRDGLEMDVLRAPLGPVLPSWPAGLVLRTVLSGDVVVRAEVEVLPGASGSGAGAAADGAPTVSAGDGPAGGAARRLDAAVQVLRLAGAVDLAAAAVRLRDAALDADADADADAVSTSPDAPASSSTSTTSRPHERSFPALRRLPAKEGGASPAPRRLPANEGAAFPAPRRLPARDGGGSGHLDDFLRTEVGALRRRVERSRVLAWSLRGVGGRDDLRDLLPGLLDPEAHDDDPAARTRATIAALPERLVGTELVTARLVVAALDLRTDALDAVDLAALAPHGDDSDDSDADASDREHAHG